jgi:hypothetical protein
LPRIGCWLLQLLVLSIVGHLQVSARPFDEVIVRPVVGISDALRVLPLQLVDRLVEEDDRRRLRTLASEST